MTPEEKEARRAAREIKKAAEKAAEERAEHEEFLKARESFHSSAPLEALRLLARAEQHLLVHTKVMSGSHPRKDGPDEKYLHVQFWTGDGELEVDLYVWEAVTESKFELNCRQWEFESSVSDFERYEKKLNDELERQQKRRELLERLSAEERELLGV